MNRILKGWLSDAHDMDGVEVPKPVIDKFWQVLKDYKSRGWISLSEFRGSEPTFARLTVTKTGAHQFFGTGGALMRVTEETRA